MKKLFLILSIILVSTPVTIAQDEEDVIYPYCQNAQISACTDLNVIREIKGGTKFVVDFQGNWDEDMKGAFRYACEIWEENLPTMLPIKIKASIGTIRQSGGAGLKVSRVRVNRMTNGVPCTLTQSKFVIFEEYNRGNNVNYTNLQDSLDLCNPDFEITYNIQLMNTDYFSYSLLAQSTSKIDFITQALRDIAVGLGFSTRFVPLNNQLVIPDSAIYSGLEVPVVEALDLQNSSNAYQMATQGSLTINIPYYGNLTLYAPTTWVQNLSLNTFIPQSDSGLSQLLTYQFGKGTVIRDITDQYQTIFRQGFGWQGDIAVGTMPNSIGFQSCYNNEVVAYHGTITNSGTSSIPNILLSTSTPIEPCNRSQIATRDETEDYDIESYCSPFDPTLQMNGNTKLPIWTFALLKKDGTWDVIYEQSILIQQFEMNLANVTLHFPEDEYARTTDNYLKGRLSHYDEHWDYLYHQGYLTGYSKYYVLDYTPQKVEMNLAKTYDNSYLNNEYLRDVEIAMSNIEGVTALYVEQLEEGEDFPIVTALSDLKSGRFLSTVDKEYASEYTIVSYNANGTKRSEALLVEPLEPAELNVSINNNKVHVSLGHKRKKVSNYTCELTRIGTNSIQQMPTFKTLTETTKEGELNLSSIEPGLYILKVIAPNGRTSTKKFFKL